MTSPKPTNIRGWSLVVLLIIAALSISLTWLARKSPRPHDPAETSVNNKATSKPGNTPTSLEAAPSAANHLSSIPIIVLNNGNVFPVEIKVGEKYIKIPGPVSWPRGGDSGPSGSQTGRFVAAIIDTADVLKANGFNPDDTFSLVVGGTTLNASNTFRVAGNHQPTSAPDNSDGYAEEYHTLSDEQGIWRSLKFKNIVVSYGQIPSLADFLAAPQTKSSMQSIPDQKTAINKPSTQYYGNPSEMVAAETKVNEDLQKYRDALNSPDPAKRADGIKQLMLYGDQLTSDNSSLVNYLNKALADDDAKVREAALNSLDLWDGDVPLQVLSRVVLNDVSAEIRLHALSSLTDRFGERSIATLQQASHDPDSRVAEKAGQLLDELTP